MTDLHRRNLLALGAAVSAGGAAVAAVPARAGDTPTLTPQLEEGPFYLADPPMRADLAEGLPGAPMMLCFAVRDETGAPLAGARIDVWHCDVKGRYSGFGAAPGEPPSEAMRTARFLRGAQLTGPDGAAVFTTVYPGWYHGRTTHIHFKVWHAGVAVLTSQAFLPDALNELLYTQAPDYRRTEVRDTLNRTDGIARSGGERAAGSVREQAHHYRVDIAVVADRSAKPVAEHGPGGRPPFGHPPFGPPPGGFAGGKPPGPPPAGLPHGPPAPGFGGPGGSPPHGPVLTGEARIAALLPSGKA